MGSYLITNVRVLDGTGREPFPGGVRVDGNRITTVTTAATRHRARASPSSTGGAAR